MIDESSDTTEDVLMSATHPADEIPADDDPGARADDSSGEAEGFSADESAEENGSVSGPGVESPIDADSSEGIGADAAEGAEVTASSDVESASVEEEESVPEEAGPSRSKPARPAKPAARRPVAPREETPEPVGVMDWYILKVQSNRENSIADALQRRVNVAGLSEYFAEIIVPVEMVTEFKGGKKKVVKRKLYPGYIVVHMLVNEDTWFLVRETPGVGDFTGAGGKPTPMDPRDVARIKPKDDEGPREEAPLKINFKEGDRVKITDGTFDNFEGEVSGIDKASGRVTVMINIFGRSTPVELEYWQVEAV